MSTHHHGSHLFKGALEYIADADGTIISPHDIAHFLHHQPRMEFAQTNLVSDGFVPAAYTDSHLINPWGVSFSPTGPFWVSDAGTGVTTIYDGTGKPVAAANHFVIDIAKDSSGHSTPTGQAFNSTASGFQISADGVTAKSAFIFVTTQGTISGWAPTVAGGETSVIAVDKSADGAAYTGVTLSNTGQNDLLYAANFRNGTVDVFDQSWQQVDCITDPCLPEGYAPFNVKVLDGALYVTYAQRNPSGPGDVPGRGHGFIDKFDLEGHLIERVASRGALDSPWGLTIAPSSFGKFAGDLLVGNFGDGTINVYDFETDHFLGKLQDSDGKPIQNDKLWEITTGNGGTAGDKETLYFTAGIGDEQHGLFGSINSA